MSSSHWNACHQPKFVSDQSLDQWSFAGCPCWILDQLSMRCRFSSSTYCTSCWLTRSCKERKRKEVYLYSVIYCDTLKALRRGSHSFTCKYTTPAFPSWAFTRCHHHSNCGSRHPIAAHYSFVDPERTKGWVGLVAWPIADGLPHKWSPISYERRTAKAHRPKTDALPLEHATN